MRERLVQNIKWMRENLEDFNTHSLAMTRSGYGELMKNL